MLITCPRCLTRYRLADEITAGRPQLDLLCSRCEFEFVLPTARDVTSDVAGPGPENSGEAAAVDAGGCELLEKVPDGAAPVAEPRSRGLGAFYLLAVILVFFLALAAGYMLWQARLEALTGNLRLVDVCGRVVRQPAGERRAELTGTVVNASRYPVLNLQLAGVLLDHDGRRRARAAGGLTGSSLKVIAPGERREFRLVCADCPPAVENYQVEIESLTVDTGTHGSE